MAETTVFNVTCNVTERYSNATEEDKEEIEKDKEKRIIDYKSIVDMYNDTCVSFPRQNH